jgi:cholesterol transport system auxiliary component
LEVVVGLNIKIVAADEDLIIASQSFEKIQPSASDSAEDLAVAFDNALGTVLRKAVEWSIRRIHSHARVNKSEDLSALPLPDPGTAPEPMPTVAALE